MSTDYNFLNDLSLKELKEIAKNLEIDTTNFKKEAIISLLKNGFKKYGFSSKIKEEKKEDEECIYKKLDKVGYKSKEGEVFIVKKNGKGKELIMKLFKRNKSEKNITKEALFLERAGKKGIAPKMVEYNTKDKWIVMDKLDKSLFDILKESKGKISQKYQKRMIDIFKKLDEIGIFHGDPSPLNFMEKDGELYIIDFGFSSEIDDKSISKTGSRTPNISFMILGYLLKIKDMCDISVYKEFIRYLSKEEKDMLGL